MQRPHPLLAFVCLVLLVAGLLAGPASAQGQPVPLGPELVANETLGFPHEWGKVSMAPDASGFAVAYEWVVGHDVYLRYFDANGQPTGGEVRVNDTLTNHIQDEPMTALDAAGNLLVCWSDRHGYDGWQMGCFGRVFDAAGAPLGDEFQINLDGATASQWEPMPVALPGGGWVVAFNGDNDGNAYLRYFDTDGTPRTGDVPINTFLNNGQTEAECAVLPDGTVLAVYADFGANVQGGTGTNLLARRFDIDGNALDLQEFVVNDSTLDYDQLEPRIDTDAANTFVMVWQDGEVGGGNDLSGRGIYARRYDGSGAPLGPEWRVNTTTLGDQLLPEVAVDDAGRFVVVWQDESAGNARIVAQRYGAAAQPLGGEVVVSQGQSGDYERPQVALDAAGTTAVFSYSGPGNATDIYVRRYSLPAVDGPPPTLRVGGARGQVGRSPTAPGPPQAGAPKLP